MGLGVVSGIKGSLEGSSFSQSSKLSLIKSFQFPRLLTAPNRRQNASEKIIQHIDQLSNYALSYGYISLVKETDYGKFELELLSLKTVVLNCGVRQIRNTVGCVLDMILSDKLTPSLLHLLSEWGDKQLTSLFICASANELIKKFFEFLKKNSENRPRVTIAAK